VRPCLFFGPEEQGAQRQRIAQSLTFFECFIFNQGDSIHTCRPFVRCACSVGLATSERTSGGGWRGC